MPSVIREINYQPETEELSIWFGPEHRRYNYAGVPAPLYAALRDAPSRGAFFNQHIRDRYPCRLADVPEKIARRWQAIRSAT